MDEVRLYEWMKLLMSGFLVTNVFNINGLDLVLNSLLFAGEVESTMVLSVIAI